MHCYLIGRKQNLSLSRKLIMMERSKKYSSYLLLVPRMRKMGQTLTKGRRLKQLILMVMQK